MDEDVSVLLHCVMFKIIFILNTIKRSWSDTVIHSQFLLIMKLLIRNKWCTSNGLIIYFRMFSLIQIVIFDNLLKIIIPQIHTLIFQYNLTQIDTFYSWQYSQLISISFIFTCRILESIPKRCLGENIIFKSKAQHWVTCYVTLRT